MKKILLAVLSLGMVAAAPLAQAERFSVDVGGGNIRVRDGRDFHHGDRDWHHGDRDFHRGERVVSETSRKIIEPDGDRVIITRRVIQQPDGDRVVRESRRVIDRD